MAAGNDIEVIDLLNTTQESRKSIQYSTSRSRKSLLENMAQVGYEK